MMVGRLEGRYLEMLTFALGARSVLEIGTFGGYSALSMAAGLAPGGRITSCEISPVHAEFARRHIAASPYADRIDVVVGPAIDTIATLDGPFDLVFIDADKAAYPDYFEAVLPKLAPRGLIAADNTLWSGRILDPDDRSEDTVALRAVQRCAGGRPAGGGGPDHRPGRGHPHPAGRVTPRSRSVLDYHLHLWPHSQSDAETTVEQVAAYCDARGEGRGLRDRRHRAPVPVHPGQGPARRVLGRPPRRGPAAGDGRVLGPPRPGGPRRLCRGGRGGEGRRAARRARPRGRLLPGPDGRGGRAPRRLPLRRPARVGALAGDLAVRRPERPGGHGRVGGPRHRRRCGTSTPGPWRSWGSPGSATSSPIPTWSRSPGWCPRCPTSSTTGSPRRRCGRGWRPSCPRPAGGSRWARSTRRRRCSSGSSSRACP